MPTFRKMPVEIEAVRWTGSNTPEISQFTGIPLLELSSPPFTGNLRIKTLEGVMLADKGDWIIRGVEGEFYPCKPSVFNSTYEPVT